MYDRSVLLAMLWRVNKMVCDNQIVALTRQRLKRSEKNILRSIIYCIDMALVKNDAKRIEKVAQNMRELDEKMGRR